MAPSIMKMAFKSLFSCVFGLSLLSAAVFADLLPLPVTVFPQSPSAQSPVAGLELQTVAILPDELPPDTPEPTAAVTAQTVTVPRQQLLHPDDYQDWRAATADGLGEQLRTHRVRLDANGEFLGRLTTLDPETRQPAAVRDVEIALVQKDRVVQRLRPNRDGQFKSRGLDTGVYDLIASGPDGYTAFAFQLLPAVIENMIPEEEGPLMQVPNELKIDTLVVPPRDAVALGEITNIYVPKAMGPTDLAEPPRDQLPDGVLTLENNPGMDEEEGAVAPGTTMRWHRVKLQSDGRVVGRMRRLHPRSGRSLHVTQARVFLLQNNRVVANRSVDALGVFWFTNVAPGVYSVVAIEASGFSAFGFEAVGEDSQPPVEASPECAEPQEAGQANPAETEAVPVLDALDFAVVTSVNVVRAAILKEADRPAGQPVAGEAPATSRDRTGGSSGSGGGGGKVLGTLLTRPLLVSGGIGVAVLAGVGVVEPPPASPSGEDSGIARRMFYFGEDQPWLQIEER